ncbi:MAG: hypothetical protein J07HB67_02185 [halophilic archaeon J07HB67]|jgi:Protein of unknown function (DUF433).|nr:MAG: hypothetical protein J07HB67_02185 [halophilic archaeon J07HB67]
MSEGQPADGRTTEGSVPTVVQTDGVPGWEPRIDGRRVGVYDVYSRYQQTESVDETATAYRLSEPEVYTALAYAAANPDQMAAIAEHARELYEQHASEGLTPESA